MISRTNTMFAVLALALLSAMPGITSAFVQRPALVVQRPALTVERPQATFELGIFNKKKQEDFSDIESRDMTRAEMLALNDENEKIMNAELWGMTGFSLVVSLPIFYLVWVAFFADTAGDIDLADVIS
jgi:disulfide bond formation protein DsbB